MTEKQRCKLSSCPSTCSDKDCFPDNLSNWRHPLQPLMFNVTTELSTLHVDIHYVIHMLALRLDVCVELELRHPRAHLHTHSLNMLHRRNLLTTERADAATSSIKILASLFTG